MTSLSIPTPAELREAQKQHAAEVERQTARLSEPLKEVWLSQVAKALSAQRTKERSYLEWVFPPPEIPDFALGYDETAKYSAAMLSRNRVVEHLMELGFCVEWISSNTRWIIGINWDR